MSEKPNHICKNPNCKKNETHDGPAHYYACNKCLEEQSGHRIPWREYCCSIECFSEFIRLMEENKLNPEFTKAARENNKKELEPVKIQPRHKRRLKKKDV